MLRFTETGAADTTFANPSFHYIGAGGSGIEAIPDAVAPNGDIVVVVGDQVMFAQSDTTILNGLACLPPSGELDTTFGNGGTVANNDPPGSGSGAVVIQPGGNIVVAGVTTNNELFLSRYLGQ